MKAIAGLMNALNIARMYFVTAHFVGLLVKSAQLIILLVECLYDAYAVQVLAQYGGHAVNRLLHARIYGACDFVYRYGYRTQQYHAAKQYQSRAMGR